MARYDLDRSLLIIIYKKKKKKQEQKKNITKATDKFENDRVGYLKTPTRWRNVDCPKRNDFSKALLTSRS